MENIPTSLDTKDHALKFDARDQTWYSNSDGWDGTKLGNEFANWLGELSVGSWKKLDRYKVTKLS